MKYRYTEHTPPCVKKQETTKKQKLGTAININIDNDFSQRNRGQRRVFYNSYGIQLSTDVNVTESRFPTSVCWWEISLQHDRFRPHHQAPLGTVLLQHVKHLKFLAAVKDCMLALLLSNSQEHSLPITAHSFFFIFSWVSQWFSFFFFFWWWWMK